jgi:hypothetical protein
VFSASSSFSDKEIDGYYINEIQLRETVRDALALYESS